VGAGVLEGAHAGRTLLQAQDRPTALLEQEAETSAAPITGSMIGHIEPANAAAVVVRMARPDIRIVSLTITEGGCFPGSDDRFGPEHPAIRADAAAPDAPRTVLGMIPAGLPARRGWRPSPSCPATPPSTTAPSPAMR